MRVDCEARNHQLYALDPTSLYQLNHLGVGAVLSARCEQIDMQVWPVPRFRLPKRDDVFSWTQAVEYKSSRVVGPIRGRDKPVIVDWRSFHFPGRWVYTFGKDKSSGDLAVDMEIEIDFGTSMRFDVDFSRPHGPETLLRVGVDVVVSCRNRRELKLAFLIRDGFELHAVFKARENDGVVRGWVLCLLVVSLAP